MRSNEALFEYEADPQLDRLLNDMPAGAMRELIDARAYTPSDFERTKAIDMITFLRAVLPLPPRITIGFRYAEGKARGCGGMVKDEGFIYINLAEVLDHDALTEVLLHEAAHVSDCHTGIWNQCTRAQRERRAIAFANSMMGRG